MVNLIYYLHKTWRSLVGFPWAFQLLLVSRFGRFQTAVKCGSSKSQRTLDIQQIASLNIRWEHGARTRERVLSLAFSKLDLGFPQCSSTFASLYSLRSFINSRDSNEQMNLDLQTTWPDRRLPTAIICYVSYGQLSSCFSSQHNQLAVMVVFFFNPI